MRRRHRSWLAAIGSGCVLLGVFYTEPPGSALRRAALLRDGEGQLRRGAPGGARLLAASLSVLPFLRRAACPRDMVLVKGQFCPAATQRCVRYVDPLGSALHGQRCAEYEKPTRCKSEHRLDLRYCIDKDEHASKPGGLPTTTVTAGEARSQCRRAGKRLCTEREWTFACEGVAARPYPYGFARDSERCNADQVDLVTASGELKDFRSPAGAHPLCTSAFGVRDMTGNVEEYVVSDSDPTGVLRKGGYWEPAANGCRAVRALDDTRYRGLELGFRCCADAGGT